MFPLFQQIVNSFRVLLLWLARVSGHDLEVNAILAHQSGRVGSAACHINQVEINHLTQWSNRQMRPPRARESPRPRRGPRDRRLLVRTRPYCLCGPGYPTVRHTRSIGSWRGRGRARRRQIARQRSHWAGWIFCARAAASLFSLSSLPRATAQGSGKLFGWRGWSRTRCA